MIKIYEKAPNGENSIKSAVNWLGDIEKKAENTKPLWQSLTPDVKQAITYEFSEANPNGWMALSEKWLERKRKEGKPDTIGIYTGELKKGATDDAEIKYLSDSKKLMHEGDFIDIINSGKYPKIQLLIHPFWWNDTYTETKQDYESYIKFKDCEIKKAISDNSKIFDFNGECG